MIKTLKEKLKKHGKGLPLINKNNHNHTQIFLNNKQ